LQLRKFGRAGRRGNKFRRLVWKTSACHCAGETFNTGNDFGADRDRVGQGHVRAIMLAELLLQDAELAEWAGQKREALISRAQGRGLVAQNLAQLLPRDQTIYRAKLDALNQSKAPSKDR